MARTKKEEGESAREQAPVSEQPTPFEVAEKKFHEALGIPTETLSLQGLFDALVNCSIADGTIANDTTRIATLLTYANTAQTLTKDGPGGYFTEKVSALKEIQALQTSPRKDSSPTPLSSSAASAAKGAPLRR